MLNKKVLKKIDISPMTKPLGDTGINFYNQDINTAVLSFQVTKDGIPLAFSEETAKTLIAVGTADGSFFVDNMTVVDALNGIIEYTLTPDILARPGKATAQIYINVNGESTTVTTVTANFTISAALINEIDANLKIVYIRTIEDLKQSIVDSLKPLEAQIEAVNNQLINGDYALNTAVNDLVNGVKKLLTNHEANKENPHNVTKAQIGLSNVDNTADINKPVSAAQTEYINDTITTVSDTLNTQITELGVTLQNAIPAEVENQLGTQVNDLVSSAIQATKDELNANIATAKNQITTAYTAAIDAIKPVLLFEGAASIDKDGAAYVYTLNRPVTDFKYYRVMWGFSGGNYRVSEFDSLQTIPTIQEFNMQDADGAQPRMYELMMDFSTPGKFSLQWQHAYNITTANVSLNSGGFVIRRIEGIPV